MPKLKSAFAKVKLSKTAILNHPITRNLFGLLFLSLALILLIVPIQLPTQKQSSKNPIVINSQLLSSKNVENIPQRIIIPGVNIDLPIVSAKVIDGYWELSEHTASYGLGSGIPGTKSNTVIFAHARVGLFYNLKGVKVNNTIYILTKNQWYRYKVNKITAVFPNQTDVIMPTKNEEVTLYTCTGFYDEKRLIIQAIPEK